MIRLTINYLVSKFEKTANCFAPAVDCCAIIIINQYALHAIKLDIAMVF